MNADKKKLAILGLLGACLVGVGVFQFVAPSEDPKPPAKAPSAVTNDEQTTDGTDLYAANADDDPIRSLYKFPLPERDPFRSNPAALQTVEGPKAPSAPVRYTPPPQPEIKVPPMPVFSQNGEQGLSVSPSSPLPGPRDFGYSLSGIITGSKSAAVFTDESGNQRLVLAGASIDGDSQLVKVSHCEVVVRYRGKIKTLTLGGNPNAQ